MFDNLLSKNGLAKSDIGETMYRKMDFQYQLLHLIKSAESTDRVSYITKKSLSENLECSPTLIYKTIKLLHEIDNMVERIDTSIYKVHESDVIRFGPFSRYFKFLKYAKENPDFIKLNWKVQAEILNIPFQELQIVYGWVYTGLVEEAGKQ